MNEGKEGKKEGYKLHINDSFVVHVIPPMETYFLVTAIYYYGHIHTYTILPLAVLCIATEDGGVKGPFKVTCAIFFIRF